MYIHQNKKNSRISFSFMDFFLMSFWSGRYILHPTEQSSKELSETKMILSFIIRRNKKQIGINEEVTNR